MEVRWSTTTAGAALRGRPIGLKHLRLDPRAPMPYPPAGLTIVATRCSNAAAGSAHRPV
jgi:hypothetical protein